MVTTATNVQVFDKELYQALAERASAYARENALVNKIPVALAPFNMEQYKKPVFGETDNIRGGRPSVGDKVTTRKDTKVFELADVYMTLYWDQYDIMKEGKFLEQMKTEQLQEWARQANMSLLKGVFDEGYSNPAVAATGSAGQGNKLINGILDDADTVADLDGTDSALTAAGDVYAALVKMVTSIPFRYVQGKEIILGMTPHFYEMANSATFTNTAGKTEWEMFMDKHVSGPSPYKVSSEIMFSDDLFKVAGDVTNTNDRLFAVIAEPNIIERAYSRGFGKMGPDIPNSVGGIEQTWTVKEAGCVIRPEAVLLSEVITW